jgi:hypothetical protein
MPPFFLPMLERNIQRLATDDPGAERAAAIRERLRGHFPPGATRRMTTLGLLVGSALEKVVPGEDDSIVYATGYSESCALEGFLDSFPTPSPTLFQTSIHPSAVQQLMIGRQRPVSELLPLSGGNLLAFHAMRASLLSTSPRSILCGGEEEGTWLRAHGLASARTFAFAASLTRGRADGDLGSVRLSRDDGAGTLGLPELFDLLHGRTPFDGMIALGWRLALTWR